MAHFLPLPSPLTYALSFLSQPYFLVSMSRGFLRPSPHFPHLCSTRGLHGTPIAQDDSKVGSSIYLTSSNWTATEAVLARAVPLSHGAYSSRNWNIVLGNICHLLEEQRVTPTSVSSSSTSGRASCNGFPGPALPALPLASCSWLPSPEFPDSESRLNSRSFLCSHSV